MSRHLQISLKDLQRYPLRSFLVATSLTVGVLAVVGVTTVGDVTEDIFVAREEQVAGRAPTFSTLLDLPRTTTEYVTPILKYADRVGLVSGANVVLTFEGTVLVATEPSSARPPLTAIAVTWVAGDLSDVKRLPLVTGEWISNDAVYPPEIVLNMSAAEELGGVGTVVGVGRTGAGDLMLSTVVGIVSDGATEMRLYGAIVTAMALDPALLETPINMSIHDSDMDLARAESITEDAAFDARLIVAEPTRRTDTVAEIANQLSAQRSAFLVASGVALLVAALGMLNIGLASVRERSRELTVRRAVGATRADIFITVLLSPLIVAIVVSSLTIALAVTGVLLLPLWFAPDSPLEAPNFPWSAAALGVLAAVVTALLGSAAPAAAASRTDPADALRE